MSDVDTLYKPITWAEVINNPDFQNLPYKFELSKDGKIEMSPPPGHQHARNQMQVGLELAQRPGGVVLGECGIQTSDGVRAPDACWISDARVAAGLSDPLAVAPEICVEVRSPSNTYADLKRKAALFIEAGALEVWIVQPDGKREVIKA